MINSLLNCLYFLNISSRFWVWQVDAALGAEEMVETLGQQKLSLEEKVKELDETVAELEELQEVNDQLQEGFKEQEQDFRQELDLKNLQIWEVQTFFF